MNIVENRDIRTFLLSLFISIVFAIFFYAYFVGSLDEMSVFLIWYGLPLTILYIMGYLVLILEEKKRNMVGWIMISCIFLYLLYLSCWFILAGVYPPVKKNLADVFREIASILSFSAMWYGFIAPIFWSCKMKKHLYGVALSIIIIIGVLFFGEVVI